MGINQPWAKLCISLTSCYSTRSLLHWLKEQAQSRQVTGIIPCITYLTALNNNLSKPSNLVPFLGFEAFNPLLMRGFIVGLDALLFGAPSINIGLIELGITPGTGPILQSEILLLHAPGNLEVKGLQEHGIVTVVGVKANLAQAVVLKLFHLVGMQFFFQFLNGILEGGRLSLGVCDPTLNVGVRVGA